LCAIFENGCRADVVDLSAGDVYEVLCNEKEEDCDKKVKNYPKKFRIIKIKI